MQKNVDITQILLYKHKINQYNLYIMKIKNTLSFFREFYQIPQKVGLVWCILLEFKHGECANRLGVYLQGTDKAIDVAARRFVQIDGKSEVNYQALPAIRISQTNNYLYQSGNITMSKPKTYVQDIYFRCVYSPELQEAVLL